MSNRLTAVLAAITNHWREYGVPPTIRYIGDTVGIPSNSTVHLYFRQLEKKGEIVMSGSPGSDPKPVPVPLFNLIKESLPNE